MSSILVYVQVQEGQIFLGPHHLQLLGSRMHLANLSMCSNTPEAVILPFLESRYRSLKKLEDVEI